jgi:hypothetical protein
MESASFENQSDLQALRDEYSHLALELRRGPIKPVKVEKTEEAKGFKARISALIENIGGMFNSEGEELCLEHVSANISTAEKILTFAQKPEFADAAKDWEKLIDLMILAQRRIKIFTEEQQVAHQEVGKSTRSYSPGKALKAHEKMVMASKEVTDNTQAINHLAKELIDKIHDVLKVNHS